jgi:hypothetical protein
MKADSQLQHDVMAELEWDPIVDHADIGRTLKITSRSADKPPSGHSAGENQPAPCVSH